MNLELDQCQLLDEERMRPSLISSDTKVQAGMHLAIVSLQYKQELRARDTKLLEGSRL